MTSWSGRQGRVNIWVQHKDMNKRGKCREKYQKDIDRGIVCSRVVGRSNGLLYRKWECEWSEDGDDVLREFKREARDLDIFALAWGGCS